MCVCAAVPELIPAGCGLVLFLEGSQSIDILAPLPSAIRVGPPVTSSALLANC